jgi:sec-independent protein translocase protein TatC
VAAAVPLFAAGIGLAWLVLPNAIRFFFEFTPQGAANLISADEYLTFVTQIFLAFGIAFVIPLLFVGLNLVGVLSALTLAKGWRIAVFLIFLFAAIASPSPDAGSMLALAFPMVGLYLVAVGICYLNDRRRLRRNPFAELDDDEASPLDDAPLPVDDADDLPPRQQ